MRYFFLLSCLIFSGTQAQNLSDCRQRFTTYLNFHNSLSSRVVFTDQAIVLYNGAGKPEFKVHENEIPLLAYAMLTANIDQQIQLVNAKGVEPFSKKVRDSLTQLLSASKKEALASDARLYGLKIAIDPGHFGTSLKEAKAEQKYLYFPNTQTTESGDSIKLFESRLTFQTASVLKAMLSEKGAEVMLTRNESNSTSFNCTYAQWIKIRKKKVLDSLFVLGDLSPAKHKALLKANEQVFFWDFFRDYELANRARKINAFQPVITVIIHYNVDEKNAPWKKASDKNFTMAFIGGGFTASDLNGQENKIHFLRLLLSDQLNRSEQLAAHTVNRFTNYLGIPPAKTSDATYLADKCVSTPSKGVYCRNLALCRKVNSTLVYGESLYQDHRSECVELMKEDKLLYGIQTSARVELVAKSYFEAIMDFLK